MTSLIGTLSHEITVSILIFFYFFIFVNPVTRGEVTDLVKFYSCMLHAIKVHKHAKCNQDTQIWILLLRQHSS